MSLEQVIVCSVFAAIVYGIGFWRGLRQGHELAGRGDR